MTIIEFLTARYDEDEDFARACGADPKDDSPVRWVYDRADGAELKQFGDDLPDGMLVRSWQYRKPVQAGDWVIVTYWEEDGEHIARHDPAHVLADIAAKRAIVAWCSERDQIYIGTFADDPDAARPEHFAPGGLSHLSDSVVLRHLAAVYADHPDYRQEWKP